MSQLQRRTRHPLVSDTDAWIIHHRLGPITCREAERETESRYPTHRWLRESAEDHFLSRGWDVVPHGVGVDGTSALADLMIRKAKKIVFVECLTQNWVRFPNAQRKRQLERYFPVWFVIEAPLAGETLYRRRADRLAKRSRVLLWSKGKELKRHSSPPMRQSGGRRRATW
jgi:hypothetical protein